MKNITMILLAAAAMGAVSIGSASAMPFSNLSAALGENDVQDVRLVCGRYHRCYNTYGYRYGYAPRYASPYYAPGYYGGYPYGGYGCRIRPTVPGNWHRSVRLRALIIHRSPPPSVPLCGSVTARQWRRPQVSPRRTSSGAAKKMAGQPFGEPALRTPKTC